MKHVLSFFFLLMIQVTMLEAQNAMYEQIPGAEYAEGEMFVKIKEDAHRVLPTLKRGETVKEDYPVLGRLISSFGIVEVSQPFTLLQTPFFKNIYKVQFTQTGKTQLLWRELNNLPEVEFAERVPLDRLLYNPNDPLEDNGEQAHLNLINAYAAWDITLGLNNIVVAVCDDAVKITHEDLAPCIWTNNAEIPDNGLDDDSNGLIDDYNGWDFADNDKDTNPPGTATAASFSHGTHCAGIAGAATNNNLGLASLGSGVKIMPMKATANTTNNTSIITHGWQGVEYAIQKNADVISISWGSTAYSSVYENLVTYAVNQGIVIVAAAGNSNSDQPLYPAAYGPVIAVAACENNGVKSSYSNYGAWIDITAPGSMIKSSLASANNAYGIKSGTSMSAPLVSGLCALMLSGNPNLTPAEVLQCLSNSATNINSLNPGFNGKLGAGLINAQAAVQCAAPNAGCMVPYNLQATAVTGTGATLTWGVVPNASSYTLKYKPSNIANWTTVTASGNNYTLTGLSSCTSYEFQVRSICSGSQPTEFSASGNFGTGIATPLSYCTATANSCASEWIAQVALNTMLHNSQGSSGYQDNTCTNTALTIGSAYALLLTPGFSGSSFNEYWRVWIDYNQDGDFTDAGELAFDPGILSAGTVNGSLTIPATALAGTTRMRVAMKWLGNNDVALPLPCTNFQYGEVEDYTIQINPMAATACNAPQNATTQVVTHNSATLNWSVPDAPFSALYTLQYRLNSQTAWQTITNIGNINLPYTITGLNSGSIYQYRIATNCGNNQTSDYSPTGTFTTALPPCDTPSGITASGITNTSVNINWSNVSGAASYEIRYRQQGATAWLTVSAAANSQSLAGLAPGTSYEYQIRTLCGGSNAGNYTVTYTFTTVSGCSMPAGLAASNITGNSVQITWTAQPGAIAYTVRYRKQTNSAWTNVGAATASITLNSLLAESVYEVKVKTICSSNSSSSYSAALAFTTAAANCAVPSGLGATNISAVGATLSWATVPGAIAYTVRYKLTTQSAWTEVNSTSVNTVVTALQSGSSYEFQVKANCSSAFSGSYTFTTLPAAGPCSVPAGLTSSGITAATATLSWTPVSGASGYTLRYRKSGISSWSVTSAGVSAAKTISGLTANSVYEYQVRTTCSSGNSSYSAIATFTTLPAAGACATPTGLGAIGITQTQATLTWAAVSGVPNYQLQYAVAGGAWQTLTVAANSYVLNGLLACTNYSFKVKAICSSSSSGAFSEVANFITLCTAPPAGTGSISLTYCNLQGNNATNEWIAGVQIGDLINASGSNGGYADFTGLSADLTAGTAYSITLTPGFAAQAYNEYWRVWIDLNADGDFEDTGELMLDPGSATNSALTATIIVPATATGGVTRMRVAMRFKNPTGPCGAYSYGETEDYTVNIITGSTVEEVIWPAPAMPDCSALQLWAAFEYAVEGKTVAFTNQSEGDFDRVFWSFGDGSFSEEKSPIHTFSETGDYFFNLTIENTATGCTEHYEGYVHITGGNTGTSSGYLGDD